MLKDFQAQKLRHLFKIIDFDHNGRLQKSDLEGIADNIDIFTDLLPGAQGGISLREEAHKVWDIMKDYFHNPHLDMITESQWLDFMEHHFALADHEQIRRNVKTVVTRLREVFDKNNDEKLSKMEFMTIFVSFRVEVRHVDQCFKAIDTNQDGFISDEELTQAAIEFFGSDKLDDLGNQLFGQVGSSHFATRMSAI